MNLPVENLYSKFGDPYRVVEFRAFSFNSCQAGCKNCYYQKTQNEFYDFEKTKLLAQDFKKNGYTLETLYLLPTDVFENDFNFQVFQQSIFIETADLFNYIGLASTLRNGFKSEFFDYFFKTFSRTKIELHVNLLEEQIQNQAYITSLERNLKEIKSTYGSNILLNLALNIGTEWTISDLGIIKELVHKYSHDKILELNYTFMFNEKISHEKKAKLISSSYPVLQYFGSEFRKTEKMYNTRTLLRKPSITFKNDRIYLSPIIPFDEYIFMDEPDFQLDKANFNSFLETYSLIEKRNIPRDEGCYSCENFATCLGKGFFSIANYYNLPCLKACGEKNDDWSRQ